MCCCEIDAIGQKMNETEAGINCITEHKSFEPVCLNIWVLLAGFSHTDNIMVHMMLEHE